MLLKDPAVTNVSLSGSIYFDIALFISSRDILFIILTYSSKYDIGFFLSALDKICDTNPLVVSRATLYDPVIVDFFEMSSFSKTPFLYHLFIC